MLKCHKDCAPDWVSDPTSQGYHGRVFVTDIYACGNCHGGSNLDGGVKSCETCHSGWKNNCTFCHGGMDNNTAAPPRGVKGETAKTDLAVGAHTTHVTATAKKQAYACSTCHTVPTDIFSPGHIDADGIAEVALKDCSGGTYFHAGGVCTNVYCHGPGKKPFEGGYAFWTANPTTCNSCHSPDTLGGKHDDHGFSCNTCHNKTVDSTNMIINPALHLNCVKDVSGGFSYDPSSRKCSNNSCHPVESW